MAAASGSAQFLVTGDIPGKGASEGFTAKRRGERLRDQNGVDPSKGSRGFFVKSFSVFMNISFLGCWAWELIEQKLNY